jgi:(p)ppGpp synthase/HD superfamily hydrolase
MDSTKSPIARALSVIEEALDFPLYQDEKIMRAMRFAETAHAEISQKRKITGLPYIIHPMGVAKIVAEFGGDTNMVCAAWLHDVVEDTKYTNADIKAEFGNDVAKLVAGLTKTYDDNDKSRDVKVAKYMKHLDKQSARVKTVKCADILHNSSDVVETDPKFAARYLAENTSILTVLEGGNRKLYRKLKAQLEAKLAQLSR